jgi:hypothetical protein
VATGGCILGIKGARTLLKIDASRNAFSNDKKSHGPLIKIDQLFETVITAKGVKIFDMLTKIFKENQNDLL